MTHSGYIEVDIPAATAAVTRLRRGPRWLLPAALSLAVAVGAAIALVLALSSSPKPPTFLGTNSPTAGTSGTATHGGLTADGAGDDGGAGLFPNGRKVLRAAEGLGVQLVYVLGA